MSTTGPGYGAWKDSFLQADEAAAQAPASFEDISAELKGLGVLALLGVGLLIVGAVFSALNLNYVIGGEPTTGVVVDFRVGHSRRHGQTYTPVVAYVVDGAEYVVPNAIGCTSKTYRLNQEVPVLYLPSDPARSTIADFLQLYLLPTILLGLGTVLLTAAVGLAAYIARKSGWRLLPRLG